MFYNIMHLQLLFYFLYFITTKGNTHVIIIYVCKSNYFSCKIFQNCWDTLTLKMSLIYEMWYKFAFYPVMKNNAFFIKKCFSIFLVWLKSLYRKKQLGKTCLFYSKDLKYCDKSLLRVSFNMQFKIGFAACISILFLGIIQKF